MEDKCNLGWYDSAARMVHFELQKHEETTKKFKTTRSLKFSNKTELNWRYLDPETLFFEIFICFDVDTERYCTCSECCSYVECHILTKKLVAGLGLSQPKRPWLRTFHIPSFSIIFY